MGSLNNYSLGTCHGPREEPNGCSSFKKATVREEALVALFSEGRCCTGDAHMAVLSVLRVWSRTRSAAGFLSFTDILE